MIRAIVQKTGASMQLLVPFHSLADSGSCRLMRDLRLENSPAVFIPIHRG